jgi:hypothetical protein
MAERQRWTIAVHPREGEEVLAMWRSDLLPDVQAIRTVFAPREVRILQYRFRPADGHVD